MIQARDDRARAAADAARAQQDAQQREQQTSISALNARIRAAAVINDRVSMEEMEASAKAEATHFNEYDLSECSSWSGVPLLEKIHARMDNQCGAIAFLHVSKTGGMTVEEYIEQETAKRGWSTINFATTKLRHNETVDWLTTAAWQSMDEQLASAQPRVFLRFHNGGPGLVSYRNMLDTVLMPMKANLEARGCGFLLVTMLREPAARSLSQMYYDHSCEDDECAVSYVVQKSNFQTRYVLENNCGYGENTCGRTLGRDDLDAAQRALRHFDIIGRTEDFDGFTQALNKAMGWPVMQKPNSTNLTPNNFLFKISDDGLEKFREYNRADSELYHSFCSA